MRKVILWILIAIMTLSCCAFAENATGSAVNGRKAVRTSAELYIIVNDGGKDVLLRTTPSGATVYVDRADDIDSVVPYAGGVAYLKTDGGVSAIMLCNGSTYNIMYNFDGMVCEKLNVFNDDLLVLSGGQLYSVDPNNQVCLKLSGAQILDYCVGGSYAYYLSGSDMMQYSADITENGNTTTVTAEVGCIYRLDLTSGETTLMLKSGGTDLKLNGSELYFHSMQQIYAVRNADNSYELRGRLYSLNIDKKNLNAVCTAEDNDFFPLSAGVVAWYDGTLNLLNGDNPRTLYSPENGAQVVSDGDKLYIWESGAKKLTQVSADATAETLFTGDLGTLMSVSEQAAMATPVPTAEPTEEPTQEPSVEPTAIPSENGEPVESVLADDDHNSTEWFNEFMTESQSVGDNVSADPTPIGAQATPIPEDYMINSTDANDNDSDAGINEDLLIPDNSLDTFAVAETGVLIVDSAANVRIGPGTDYDKIASIPEGKRAEILGIACKASNGTTWYKVRYNSLVGWVSSMYAKAYSGSSEAASANYDTSTMGGKYVHVIGGASNVRTGPGKEYNSLGSVPNGSYLNFTGKYAKDSNGSNWYQVTGNGKTGWISSKLTEIKDNKTSGSASTSSSSSSSGYVVTTGNVNIRSSANKSSESLGYISSGTTVTYLGSSKVDSRGVRWYKISYGGVTGWISSKYSHIK